MHYLLFLFFIFLPDQSVATTSTTYYVSPSGSDSNIGSPTAPFKTIQKAANIVKPGDTVLVRAGTYAGFKVFRSGTSGNYIVFKAYPGETVKLDSYTNNYANTWRGVEVWEASYIEINGFHITDSNPLYDSSTFADYRTGVSHEGIKLNYTTTLPQYIRIINNEIYHVGFHGILVPKGSNHIELLNNIIHDVGLSKRGYGIYVGGNYNTVQGNIVYNSYGHGIQMQNGDSSTFISMTVQNNLCYNNGRSDYNKGYSTGLYGCPGDCPNGVPVGDGILAWNAANSVIQNNIAYGNLQWGIRNRGNGNLIINNTIYHNGYQGIYAYGSYKSTIRNNISYKNGGGRRYSGDYYIGTGNSQDHNLFGVNPLFVDPNNGDFHLQSGSPAIEKGTSTQAPTLDFAGNTRTGAKAPDIGAYAYAPQAR